MSSLPQQACAREDEGALQFHGQIEVEHQRPALLVDLFVEDHIVSDTGASARYAPQVMVACSACVRICCSLGLGRRMRRHEPPASNTTSRRAANVRASAFSVRICLCARRDATTTRRAPRFAKPRTVSHSQHGEFVGR